jgi:hypothetical protein
MYWYMYVYVCAYIYVWIYICVYASWATYLLQRHRMCVSKDGINITSHNHLRECLPMVWSDSQRLHHYHMCTPPHTLHRLDLPVLLLSANVCVYHKAYICTRTHSHDDPHHTHNECECVCLQLVTPSVCATNYCHEPLNTGMMTPTTHIMSANVYASNSWHTVTQCVCHELLSRTIEYRRSVVRRAHHLCICESRVTNYVYASNSWHIDQEKKNSFMCI